VLAEDAEVRQALVERWGTAIFDGDGRVDRNEVAQRVFAQTESAAAERRFLEDLLHPRIRERLNKERDAAVARGAPAIVLDAPLLLEADWGPLCDVILMIEAPREVRLERAAARGWTEAEFDRREAAQWPADKKRTFADVVISNLRSSEELRHAVTDFWQREIDKRPGDP